MLSRLAVILIRIYQAVISPYLGSNCRFYPSCSEYAIQVYSEWGFVRGTVLTAKRLLRCGPWNAGGYDPPPVCPTSHNDRLTGRPKKPER